MLHLPKKGLRACRRWRDKAWAAAARVRGDIAESSLRQRSARDIAASMPIIINNRNRFSCLKALVGRLRHDGYENIFVLDNDSSFPPLLEYYNSGNVRVLPAGGNLGPYALWKNPQLGWLRRGYFVYTDSDVVPDDACPADYIERFVEALRAHRSYSKVGFSLRIDDLPSSFADRERVVAWESRHWEPSASELYCDAPIDTTFAVYRPWGIGRSRLRALRSKPPYSARHMPWYVDSAALDEEERYYRAHASPGASWWTSEHGRSMVSRFLGHGGRD